VSKEVTYLKTPIGIAKIVGDVNGIQSVSVVEDNSLDIVSEDVSKCLQECILQLQEYFKGKRTRFTVKLNLKGTEFQQKVWKELLKIPFGKTRSYLEQAKCLGNVKAIRAVANANGKNPIWILIPCHRVIGSNGSLTGYAGGLWRKKWLLAHENPVKQKSLF